MFCPRCAAHNIDDASYCRVCGADISLLPQVLSGELASTLAMADETAVEEQQGMRSKRQDKKDKEKEKKPPTLEKAIENIGTGIAFLVISIMIASFMPGGKFWWFWMLIPALACVGEGIGQVMRLRSEKALSGKHQPPLRTLRPTPHRSLSSRDTSEMLMPPPSITENTTRHLNPDPRSGSFGDAVENPESALDSKIQ